MRIGGKEYSEIVITDKEDNLLVSITDEDIIEEKNCKVICVPVDCQPRLLFIDLSGFDTGVATPLIIRTWKLS